MSDLSRLIVPPEAKLRDVIACIDRITRLQRAHELITLLGREEAKLPAGAIRFAQQRPQRRVVAASRLKNSGRDLPSPRSTLQDRSSSSSRRLSGEATLSVSSVLSVAISSGGLTSCMTNDSTDTPHPPPQVDSPVERICHRGHRDHGEFSGTS